MLLFKGEKGALIQNSLTTSAVNRYPTLTMKNLFAYGTLMCQDIMEEVTRCCPQRYRGTLMGYNRRSVKGEVYPALVPDEEGTVEGILYKDVPNEAWERLDQFEGEMYSHQSVQITMPDETTLLAETYVILPTFLNYLEEIDWDFEKFLQHDKSGFQME